MSVIEAPPAVLDEPEVLSPGEERLLNAERYLREHGWTRGEAIDESGRVCILGALAFGNGGVHYFETYSHYDPAYIALAKATGGSCAVMGWNDHVCRSEDEALAKLREAREILASKPRY